jgi:hypothetical protein
VSEPARSATFVVCEDGREYTERFVRLFAGFRFVRAPDFAQALVAARAGAAGLLLDLDFRRTRPESLIDEAGHARPDRPEDERRRLYAVQGILILRALRAAGSTLPALLFADLDDPAHVQLLETTLAPLTVIPSSAALPAVTRALAAMAARP